MPTASELLEQAAKSRDSAMRAHRLAGTVNEADAIRLQGYRDQLLAEASDLERQAEALGRPARMRSRQWNRDNKSSNHSKLGPPIQRNSGTLMGLKPNSPKQHARSHSGGSSNNEHCLHLQTAKRVHRSRR